MTVTKVHHLTGRDPLRGLGGSMTWLEHHERSEHLAADAEAAMIRGERSRAVDLYRQAAEEETLALEAVDTSKPRTFGITAVSAASLFYKAHDFSTAESLAHRFLAYSHLSQFAVDDLRLLLQAIWSDDARQRAGLRFAPGEVVVSVRGGEVVEGGAPLDLILEKVQTVQSLFYRTAELLRGLPHRTRGRPSREILESVRPWLFQTVPGSYQFAVAVEEPARMSLFDPRSPSAKDVATEFLRIVRASAEAPEEDLPEVVSDPAYRTTLLKLTRNLAPTGKKFAEMDIRGMVGPPITLVPETRRTATRLIRKATQPTVPPSGAQETVRGVLRALHLDEDWLEVTVDDAHVKIDRVGEAVDDVIGPMVNHPVLVQVLHDTKGRHFLDIETDE